jgi:hypothetical protein
VSIFIHCIRWFFGSKRPWQERRFTALRRAAIMPRDIYRDIANVWNLVVKTCDCDAVSRGLSGFVSSCPCHKSAARRARELVILPVPESRAEGSDQIHQNFASAKCAVLRNK